MAASRQQCHVRVLDSGTCGRKLVATSRFRRGQCILEEWPYAYTLHDNKRGLLCDFCLQKSSTLETCLSCTRVSYCSETCKKGDWKRCHEHDCKTLESMKLPHLTLLLSQIIRNQSKSPQCTQDGGDCFPTTVDQLESHHDKLSDTKMDEFESLLPTLKQFIEKDVLPEQSSLLKIFGAANCNSFTICDNDLSFIAEGIYLRASMANHSCDYNCVVVYDGRKLQLRTVKDVKEGEECTIGYVRVMEHAKERQAELEEKYHFTCKCKKCIEEIKELESVDGLGKKLQGLKKSWEQIQDAENSQDWDKVLQLCEPYLMNSSLPANHYLMVKVRYSAFGAYMHFEKWEKAAEIGKLNIDHYKDRNGRYSPGVGMHLLSIGKLLLSLKRNPEARKYLTEAMGVLMVTHGQDHSLMKTQSMTDLRYRCNLPENHQLWQ